MIIFDEGLLTPISSYKKEQKLLVCHQSMRKNLCVVVPSFSPVSISTKTVTTFSFDRPQSKFAHEIELLTVYPVKTLTPHRWTKGFLD